MSQAFVKEPDGDAVADDQPELPISPHPNYVTPGGLARLKASLKACRDKLRELDGDALDDKPALFQVAREIRRRSTTPRLASLRSPTGRSNSCRG